MIPELTSIMDDLRGGIGGRQRGCGGSFAVNDCSLDVGMYNLLHMVV